MANHTPYIQFDVAPAELIFRHSPDAHFVLCGHRKWLDDPDLEKRKAAKVANIHPRGDIKPAKTKGKWTAAKGYSWKSHKPTLAQVLAHIKAGCLVGIVPSSLRWFVFDKDDGDGNELRAKLDAAGYEYGINPTPNGEHYIVSLGHDIALSTAKKDIDAVKAAGGEVIESRQSDWAVGNDRGETRCNSGYICLYNANVLLAEYRVKGKRPTLQALYKAMGMQWDTSKPAPKPAVDDLFANERARVVAAASDADDYAGDESEYSDPDPAPAARKGEWKGLSPEERAQKLVDTAFKNCRPGAHSGRDTALYKAARQIAKYALEGHLDIAINTAVAYGLARDDAFERQVQRGLEEGRRDKAEWDAKPKRTPIFDHTENTVDRILQCAEEQSFEVRYNRRRRVIEIKVKDDRWDVHENPQAYLRRMIERHYVIVRVDKNDNEYWVPLSPSERLLTAVIDILADQQQVDVFWETRPPARAWDGKPRLDFIIETLFDLADKTDKGLAMARWASRYPFIGALFRADKPGQQIVRIPILSDQQGGAGKSLFCSMPFSPAEHADTRKAWFKDALEISNDKKAMVEMTQGGVIIELAECVGMDNERYAKSLKQYITQTDDGQVRLAYRKNPRPHPRDIVHIGTADKDKFLSNDPNVRRWGIIKVNRKFAKNRVYAEFKDFFDANRTQLWAEAMHRYEQGELPHLPEELYEYADLVARGSQSVDEVTEDLKRLTTKIDTEQNYTVANIIRKLAADNEGYDKANGRNQLGRDIKKAMLAIGWTVARTKAGKPHTYKRATLYKPPAFQPPTSEPPPPDDTPPNPFDDGGHYDREDDAILDGDGNPMPF